MGWDDGTMGTTAPYTIRIANTIRLRLDPSNREYSGITIVVCTRSVYVVRGPKVFQVAAHFGSNGLALSRAPHSSFPSSSLSMSCVLRLASSPRMYTRSTVCSPY